MNDERYLQNVLAEEIPLSRAIGITVKKYTGESLTLTAPLENNLNHKSTAFGGSLYSVAVLAGWGLLHMHLRAAGLQGKIVIHDSRVKFLHPVTGEIVATCSVDVEAGLEKFLQIYRRKGKSRVLLSAQIHDREKVAVDFTGRYVVHQ